MRCSATGWAGPKWTSSPRTCAVSAPRAFRGRRTTSNSRPSNCGPRSRTCERISAPPCMRDSARTTATTRPGASGCSRRLFLEGNEAQTEQILSGLSPEFFLQIEWLPGGRLRGGRVPVRLNLRRGRRVTPRMRSCSGCAIPRAKGIIFNLIREYGDLEYINVGCLPRIAFAGAPAEGGPARAFISPSSAPAASTPYQTLHPPPEVGRLGAPGRRQRPAASHQGERRLYRLLSGPAAGLPPVGHEPDPPRRHAPPRARIYRGTNDRYRGEVIRTIYFEREYLPGIATDKLPLENYSRPGYALRARHAPRPRRRASIVVGRAIEGGARPVFDDGDEVVREGEDGLPGGDPAWPTTAAPSANTRFRWNPSPPTTPARSTPGTKSCPTRKAFAHAYLAAFRERFLSHPGRLPQAPPGLRHTIQALPLRHRRQLRLPLGMRPAAPGPNQRRLACRSHPQTNLRAEPQPARRRRTSPPRACGRSLMLGY